MIPTRQTNGWLLAFFGALLIAGWIAHRVMPGGFMPRGNSGLFAVVAGLVLLVWGFGALYARKTGQDTIERVTWVLGAVCLIGFLFWRAFSAL
jgi:hypothetical protein